MVKKCQKQTNTVKICLKRSQMSQKQTKTATTRNSQKLSKTIKKGSKAGKKTVKNSEKLFETCQEGQKVTKIIENCKKNFQKLSKMVKRKKTVKTEKHCGKLSKMCQKQ